ncbi:uncharacterized protein LOC100367748 [Saccoglossus kowalevskii]|uniref:Uncharacterized protein LOC100367748 n=1 Tax=Saccoglossus kowalevskii TaxID=10224 RepID=A0ABM0GZC5_SACKO|nr:PREDICTED: uncharacterized protein LOC100367748 [Saccoglossus kowalevskii]
MGSSESKVHVIYEDTTDKDIKREIRKEQEEAQNKQRQEKIKQENLEAEFKKVDLKRNKLREYTFGEYNHIESFEGLDVLEFQQPGAIKIGVFGPAGAGKSSFIYTCERIINEINRGTADVKTEGGEGTIRLMDYLYGDWHYKLVDTRGFGTYGISELAAFSNILFGNVTVGNEVDFNSDARPAEVGEEGDVFNWIHSVVFVVSAKDPRIKQLETSLNPMRKYLRPRGIGTITVITHRDQVDESEIEDIKTSVSAATGSAINHTFFVTNYTGDILSQPPRPDIEGITCDVLTAALIMGERYIRIAMRKQQREAGSGEAQTIKTVNSLFESLREKFPIPEHKLLVIERELEIAGIYNAPDLKEAWTEVTERIEISKPMQKYISSVLSAN